MASRNLTDRFIQSCKPAPAGKRIDFADAVVPGLALRVTDRGHKTFVLRCRYPLNPENPTRRALGDYGALTLEEARQKGRHWLELIGKGIDPKLAEERLRAEAQRRQVTTFGAVAADFLERHAAKFSRRKDAQRIIEAEFVKRWEARPATEILPEEVAAAIRTIVKRGAPYQAHQAFAMLRLLYRWAIGTGEYGINASPTERLQPSKLIGRLEHRDRVLTDDELRRVWNAAEEMGYPYGPLIRLLILTGQREREVADTTWPEFNLPRRLWVIPASRMKGDRAHEVPIADRAFDMIEMLPRFTAGEFVFSTTAGAKAVNGFSKAKVRIDRLSGVADWKFHDLRRTMRTHLSALPVQDLVRELVIAHAKPGLHRVYDQHAYQEEKRHCLELWERRLLTIVEPPPDNVLPMPAWSAARPE
jgi:integrase